MSAGQPATDVGTAVATVGIGSRWLSATRRDRLLASSVLLVAVVAILFLGRDMSFYWDEWDFILNRSLGSPATWFAPHNEHLVAIPVVVYRLEIAAFGLGSYLPFLAVLVACHIAVVAAVATLLRSLTTPLFAALGTLLMLFLGAGGENLFWAFQIGFVGATAFGLWALHCAMTGRTAAAAGLLVLSVLTTGIGLVWVVTVIAYAVLARRRWWPYLVAPAVFGVWWLLDRPSVLYPATSPAAFAAFVVAGLAFGVALTAGIPAVAITAMAAIRDRRAPAVTLACAAGLVAMYVILAVSRSGSYLEWALSSRYVYVAAPLRGVGMGGLWGAQRPVPRLVAVSLVIGLVLNVALLPATAAEMTGLAHDRPLAEQQAAWR